MQASWKCPKHSEPIVLVCTANVWHFQGLCTRCVPEHTQSHPKNIKIQMESIKEVMERATCIKKKVSSICQQRLQQCVELQAVKEQDYYYLNSLNNKRQILIEQVNSVFDTMVEDVRKKQAKELKVQQQILARLKVSLEESIRFFQRDEYNHAEEFCREIKKYYFKQNLDVYVAEYDEVISEFREKVLEWSPLSWAKDLEGKCREFINGLHKQKNAFENTNVQMGNKKQSRRKEPHKKRCKNCGQQMEYLTEWKKHLVCRGCGGKQRNYVKR